MLFLSFFFFFDKMSFNRLKDPGFFNGSTLSFKDALSSASYSSVSFPDLKIYFHRGLPTL